MDPTEASLMQQAMGLAAAPFDAMQWPGYGRMPGADTGGALRCVLRGSPGFGFWAGGNDT